VIRRPYAELVVPAVVAALAPLDLDVLPDAAAHSRM
jgi:hypothetical protein